MRPTGSAELLRSSPNRGAVRRADALLETTDVISDVCDQKCDAPTNTWDVRCLSCKKKEHEEAFRDLAETVDTAAVPIIATK